MMRATHEFRRIEALGSDGPSGRSDRADPIVLEVRVTRETELGEIVESSSTLGTSATPNGVVPDAKKPFRLATGIWAHDLDERKYEVGRTYVVNYRYEMTPGNLKVDREVFVHRAPPTRARDEDGCVIFGTVTDSLRRPVTNSIIIVETFDDFITLTHRRTTAEIRTDQFGNWWVELQQGQLVRFVLGEITKVIRVPDDRGREQLSRIAAWQPDDVRKDKFGYPYP